ncbi:MAG: hypothetical protein JNK79_00455 [Chitinophagaceae bacterium]|nr:hypothetical protein [Chitinophagaceae bacterium]
MRIGAIAIVVILFFSCDKNKSSIERNSIIGLWKLVEYYDSEGGGGNARWKPALFSSPSYLEFTEDEMIFTGDSTVNTYSYLILSDLTLTIHGSSYDIPCNYKLELNKLLLVPLNCIEGCASKYRAIDEK